MTAEIRQPNITIPTPTINGKQYRKELQLKKPRVYEKIINYLNNLNSRNRLCSIDIAYDWVCNMRCSHCFASLLQEKKNHDRKFTLARLKKVCDEADDIGVYAISLQGGEPLFWKDLVEIIKVINPVRFNLSIVTNGFLLCKRKARQLKDLGVDRMCVSIDSGIAEEHDAFRKSKGAFSRAINGIEGCLDVNLTPHIHTVVTHESLYSEGFNRIVAYAKQREIGITVLIAIPAGEWSGDTKLLISDKDAKFIQSLHKEYPPLRRDITPVNGVDTGCRAVTYALYITASGEVLPCPFLHFTLGNVFDEPLAKILRKGYRVRDFREYRSKCLAGEDKEFIAKYMSKTFECDNLPLSVEDIFPEVRQHTP